MTISVVIPAYNEEKLLPQLLESLKKQMRPADEIIVVDASSTDKTKDVASSYGATVITVPKDTIGASRQRGIVESHSDVVAQTDADTVLPPDWLTRIERALTKPGIIGYFGGFRVNDGPGWYKMYINQIQPLVNRLMFLFRMPMATGQNMAFYKDKALAVGGIPTDFKIAEDIEIARRLMTIGKIEFRMDEYVIASGRRGNEGIGLLLRLPKVFFNYFLFRNAKKIGFPDIR